MKKKEKFIYWFIGLGCGVMVSGLAIIFVGLNMTSSQQEKQTFNYNSLVSPVTQNQDKENKASSSQIEEDTSQNTYRDKETAMVTTDVETEDVKSKDPETVDVEHVEQEVPKENPISSIQTYKWVDIPNTYSASQMCVFLEQEGIIEDAKAFRTYIRQQDMTRKLLSGKRYLPIKGEYKDILNILAAGNKN